MHLDYRGGLRQYRQVGTLFVSLQNAYGCMLVLAMVSLNQCLYTYVHTFIKIELLWLYTFVIICSYFQRQISQIMISIIPWTTTPLCDIILVITPQRKNSPQASALIQITPLMVWSKMSNYPVYIYIYIFYMPNLSQHNGNKGVLIGMFCRHTPEGGKTTFTIQGGYLIT